MKGILWKVALFLVLIFAIQSTTGTFAMANDFKYSQETIITVSILSLLIPGFGQYLLKDQNKALTHLLICIGTWIVGSLLLDYTYGLSMLLPITWHIYSAFDAFSMATRK